MSLFRTIALAAAAAVLPAVLGAQTGGSTLVPGKDEDISRVATRGAAFLSLGVGARPLALAGAYTATAADLSAMYWNVAGLGDVHSPTAMASHERLYGASGLSNTYVGGALPLLGGALGLSLTSFSSGDIDRTTEAWPDGGDPTFGSVVRWTGTAIGLHYARPFTDRLVVGATLKRADEGIQFARATYYAADVGIRFRSGLFGSTLGVAVANLGSSARIDGPAVRRRLAPSDDPDFPTRRTLDIDLQTERLQLPTALRIGLHTDVLGTPEALLQAGGPHRLTVLTDVSDAIDTHIMPAVAGEYSFRERVFLRGGGRFLNDDRIAQGNGISYTAGAGVALPVAGRRFLLDYAWRNFGELGDNQVFSFQFGY